LGQLGNRVQHALRAFTPRDQRAVAAAAQTFRPNPKLDTTEAITELGKGEALVSVLEGNGTPSVVERTMIRPPAARMGPITPEERRAVMAASPVKGKYDQTVDSESAYELLQKRTQASAAVPHPGHAPAGADAAAADEDGGGMLDQLGAIVGTIFGTGNSRGRRLTTGQAVARSVTRTVTNRVAGNIAADIGMAVGGSMGRSVGRAIVRGVLGGMLRR
jgi:DNA helicase HerA-like ATPase